MEPYKEDYLQAISLMDEGKYDECIRHARYTLTDPFLPRYWIVKNLVLIANVSNDWYDAEEWRRQAEHAWWVANRITPDDDVDAKESLQELREGTLSIAFEPSVAREIDDSPGLDMLKDDLDRQKPEDFDGNRLYERLNLREGEEEDDPEYIERVCLQLWGGKDLVDRRLGRDGAAGTIEAEDGSGNAPTSSAAGGSQEEDAVSTTGTEDVLSAMGDDPGTPPTSPPVGPSAGDEAAEPLPA